MKKIGKEDRIVSDPSLPGQSDSEAVMVTKNATLGTKTEINIINRNKTRWVSANDSAYFEELRKRG